MKKLLFAMAVGAALMWLFDPDAGARRRDTVRGKLDEMGVTSRSATAPAPTQATDYTPPSVASIP